MRFLLIGAVLLVGLVGCYRIAQGNETPLAQQCRWDSFEVAVRQGPNAGLTLQGVLTAGLMPDYKTLYGTLFVGDSGVAVSGEVSCNTVALKFHDGKGAMQGVGTLTTAGNYCQEGLTGDLTGPTAADSGDWEGQNRSLSPNCVESATNNGTVSIQCRSAGIYCTTTYFPGGASTTTCRTLSPSGYRVNPFRYARVKEGRG